jgi:hypothetical protein
MEQDKTPPALEEITTADEAEARELNEQELDEASGGVIGGSSGGGRNVH